MGSGGSVKQRATSPQDIIDYLNELFAYALSIGMTYDQYWFGDPKLINAYIKAEEIRQRKKNNEMWLQGAYVYQAVGSLIHLANPFSKEHKAKPYLDKPIPVTQQERDEIEQERYNRMLEYMQKRASKTEVDK